MIFIVITMIFIVTGVPNYDFHCYGGCLTLNYECSRWPVTMIGFAESLKTVAVQRNFLTAAAAVVAVAAELRTRRHYPFGCAVEP